METSTFAYELDETLVASHPPERRDGGRLMVLEQEQLHHAQVREFAERLPEGALVIVNDTRVIPARLIGLRLSGGKVELLLVELLEETPSKVRWRAMGKASKQLRPGSRLTFGPHNEVEAEVGAKDGAMLEITFWTAQGDEPVAAVLDRIGEMPLPPYIVKRRDADAKTDDFERYQTVFASQRGAVAAPTAGLHITTEMLTTLARRNVQVAQVTLHVGLGTFQSVMVDDLDDHPMHSERYEVTTAAADAIAAARTRGAPVVAIGTTVVRTLESTADPERRGLVVAGKGSTKLLIQPGFDFRVVDRLLTNFHLPKSTLLALVCAFGGTERILRAYDVAQRERYRFFSYGDAMYVSRTAS